MGFWYPSHWRQIATDARVKGAVDEAGHFESGVFSPEAVSLLETRDQYLEDYLNSIGSGQGGAVFSWPGVVNYGSPTGAFFYFNGAAISKVWVICGTQASTSTVFTLYKNGTPLGTTVTLPASTSKVTVALAFTLAAGDSMQAAVTTIGTGLADATLQLQ